MTSYRVLRAFLFVLAAALGAGCHTVAYNPSYIRPVTQTVEPRYPGKLLILTTPTEDQFLFEGHPKSFTGAPWDLKVPFGEITKKASGEIYGHLFAGGYEYGNVADTNRFAVIIHPRIEDYAWRMNQLKNAGFAITPQVQMTLCLELKTPDRGLALQRKYESGWVDGNSYVVNFSPFDSVSLITHKTVANLMVDSIKDLDAAIQANPSPQPLPSSFTLKDYGLDNCGRFWSTWSESLAVRNNQYGQYPCQPWVRQSRNSQTVAWAQFGAKVGAQMLKAESNMTKDNNPTPTAEDASVVETFIAGNFEGWKGSTAWAMDNGQIWRQSQLGVHSYSATHPKVLIFRSDDKWLMKVAGDNDQIQVQRIK